ncbi:hypothetical protein CEJ86_21010 [Sinorhizobium meliloti]|uniref:Uncharacterized protein n=1 Tax=Rhizobium meliloti TaxID=382 RepID=A0A2J0YZM7_RHIML|nr:hypothetical protein CEJ86_21010 [Sinorhizobium meliloti]
MRPSARFSRRRSTIPRIIRSECCNRRTSPVLIPVLVTGIQPDQVLGLKERFPRRGRGAAGSL